MLIYELYALHLLFYKSTPFMIFLAVHYTPEPVPNLQCVRRSQHTVLQLSNLNVRVVVSNDTNGSDEELYKSAGKSSMITHVKGKHTAVPVTQASSKRPSLEASTISPIVICRSVTSRHSSSLVPSISRSLASSSTLFRVTPSKIMSPSGGVSSSGCPLSFLRMMTKKLLAPASVTLSSGPNSHSTWMKPFLLAFSCATSDGA